MKKLILCVCLALMIALSYALPVSACWMAPEPFEILSDDGNRVFVFIPLENSFDDAYAAVYEIIEGERRLLYTVEDLSSFAYEGNFHFSADMMHFARVFPPYGMNTFEVFSHGIRTRVVTRDNFIEDYASVEAETSIGPFYTVTWKIEEYAPRDNAITISTSEGNTLVFDLAEARFDFEPSPPTYDEALPIEYPDDVIIQPAQLEVFSAAMTGITPIQYSGNSDIPAAASWNWATVTLIVAGLVTAFVTIGAYILIKRKKQT